MSWRGKLIILMLVYLAGFGTAIYITSDTTNNGLCTASSGKNAAVMSNVNAGSDNFANECKEILKKTGVVLKEQSLKLNDYMTRKIEEYRNSRENNS